VQAGPFGEEGGLSHCMENSLTPPLNRDPRVTNLAVGLGSVLFEPRAFGYWLLAIGY
jgi:hypothetical protein